MNGSRGVAAKTVLLHIGTAKTGTTSIQRWLKQSQANGSLGPVCYPLWQGDHNQQRLAMIYRPTEWMTEFLPTEPARFRRMRDRYRQFAFGELCSATGAIISAEMLVWLPQGRVRQLRSDLEGAGFRDFRVVLYVRDPADFYLSNTAQVLRNYQLPPLVEDPASFRYDFLRVAETWDQVFPGLNVRRFAADPHFDSIQDFADLVERYLGVSPPRIPMRVNPTLSAEAMLILHAYRSAFSPDNDGRITHDAARLSWLLRQSGQSVAQTMPKLKPEVAEQVRANHRADAEVLESRFGIDLGWRDWGPAAALSRRQSYGVQDIVESVNPDIVNQLLLRVVREELSRRPAKRSLPLRVAARAYHSIPAAHRPERLVAALRSLT